MTAFQLTPIGTSPAWYNAGEPSSGFLLEAGGARVLVDCGSGVIARYLELFGDRRPIDAIVITHAHPDHCFDLVPLKYGIDFGTLGDWRPQLWLPPGVRDRLTRLVSAWDQDFSYFADTYDVRGYGTDEEFRIGPLRCRAIHVPHYIECCALRLEHDGTSFGFTGDLGPTDRIAPFMRGVDLLLSEAAFHEDGDLDMPDRGHITATEAGRIAREAEAHSLLLTHVPEEFDLARAGERYDVARRLAAAS